MKLKTGSIIALILLFIVASNTTDVSGQKIKEKDMKIYLDELKNEVVVLERQVQSLSDTMNRNSGQMSALVTQIIDNVTAIRQAQSRTNESSMIAMQQVNGVEARLSSTNQRIDRLSEQLAELKKLIQDLPKLPAFDKITPGNPDMLFAAAYSDYSRGNYDLAISEFKQYVETYPSSEMTDNAQYWIGEALLAKRLYNQAIAQFDNVIQNYSKGDKVAAARFKKGMALIELGDEENARKEFEIIIKQHSTSNEAALARQQLGR